MLKVQLSVYVIVSKQLFVGQIDKRKCTVNETTKVIRPTLYLAFTGTVFPLENRVVLDYAKDIIKCEIENFKLTFLHINDTVA